MSFSKLDLSVLPHARSAAHSKAKIRLKYFRPKSNIFLNILDYTLIY